MLFGPCYKRSATADHLCSCIPWDCDACMTVISIGVLFLFNESHGVSFAVSEIADGEEGEWNIGHDITGHNSVSLGGSPHNDLVLFRARLHRNLQMTRQQQTWMTRSSTALWGMTQAHLPLGSMIRMTRKPMRYAHWSLTLGTSKRGSACTHRPHSSLGAQSWSGLSFMLCSSRAA